MYTMADDDYKSFLESLEAAEPVAELETTRSKQCFSINLPNDHPTEKIQPVDPKTTPLLEKLKAEKAAAKDAAQIQSYHGHYRGADRRAPASAIKSKVLPSRSDDLATFSRSLPPSGGESAKSARPITPNGKTPTKGKGKAETVPQSPSKQPPVAKTPKKTQPRPTAVRSNPAAASTKSEAVASSSANSTIVSEANNNPRPERKKQAVNPRMFEAALAGVGGGTSRRQAAAAKKLQEAAVRPPVSSTTSNAPPPSISPTISAASTASPIAPVTSSSTMEKKEKPIPTGPKNQGQNAPRLPSGEGGVQGEAAPAKGRRRGKPHPNRDSQAPIQSSATPTITPIILARPAPSVSPTSPTAGSGVPVAQRAPSTASQPNQSAASNSTTHAAAAGAPKEGAGGPPKNRRTRPGRGRGRGGAPAIATAGGSSGTTPASGET